MESQNRRLNLILKNFKLFNLQPAVSIFLETAPETEAKPLSELLKLLADWFVEEVFVEGDVDTLNRLQPAITVKSASAPAAFLEFKPKIRSYLADHPDQIKFILARYVFSGSRYYRTQSNWGEYFFSFYGNEPEVIKLQTGRKTTVIPVADAASVQALLLFKKASGYKYEFKDVTPWLDVNSGQLKLAAVDKDFAQLLVIRRFYFFQMREHFNYLNTGHLSMLQKIFRARLKKFGKKLPGVFYKLDELFPLDANFRQVLFPAETEEQPQLLHSLAASWLNEYQGMPPGRPFRYRLNITQYLKNIVFPQLQSLTEEVRLFIAADHPFVNDLPLDKKFILKVDAERFYPQTPYYRRVAVQIKRMASQHVKEKIKVVPVLLGELFHSGEELWIKRFMIDSVFVFGANHLISRLPQKLWRNLPRLSQEIIQHDPNYEEYPEWLGTIHQLGNFLKTGSGRPELLVLHPVHNSRDEQFFRALSVIEDSGLDYELVDFNLFNSAKHFALEADQINFRGRTFRIIILPFAERIPVQTLQKLHQFYCKGGIVIALGTLPFAGIEENDHERIGKLTRKLWFEAGMPNSTSFKQHESGGRAYFIPGMERLTDLVEDLAPYIRMRVRSEPGGVRHRLCEDDKHYLLFVLNTNLQREISCTVQTTYRGRPYYWDFERMESHLCIRWQLDKKTLKFRFTLAPGESRLLIIDKKKGLNNWQVVDDNCDGFALLDSAPNEVRLEAWKRQPGKGYVTLQKGMQQKISEFEINTRLPILTLKAGGWYMDSESYRGKVHLGDYSKYFPFQSAPLVYHKIIVLSDSYRKGQKVMLSLGEVRTWCAVYVNDKFVGKAWAPPWRFDITAFIRKGENKISVMVVNTISNHLAKTDSQYSVSSYGLFGPVKIIPYQKVLIKMKP